MNMKLNNHDSCIVSRVLTIIHIAIYILCSVACFAGPVASIVEEFTQPDGAAFEAIQRGDERQHWYETKDGFTIVEDRATGWWYYAEPDNEHGITKSRYVVGRDNPENFNIKKALRPKVHRSK